MSISRRNFLKVGLSSMAFFTLETTTPSWIARSAQAIGTGDCLSEDRILVIIQLAGGNDGLNTIIPVTDAAYHAARPTLGINAVDAITMDGLNSMHPALQPLADRYQDGRFAVVQNVGYVNPNLSHFTSMEYFERGYVPGEVQQIPGWASRVYDNACGCTIPDESLFYLGSGVPRIPQTMARGDCYTPPAVRDPDNYQLNADTDEALRIATIHALNDATVAPLSELEFVQRSANTMEASIADIATANATPQIVPAGSYTSDSLGRGLRLASQVIRAGFKTRIFYVTLGGFDTHANQIINDRPTERGNHPRLLGLLAQNVESFLQEMELSGNLDRTLVMTFSEFGRRVAQNASLGTDHGAANSLMMWGGSVAGGIYGGQPDLTDLQRGNLKHQIDFRTVYSYVIEEWLGCDASAVFGNTVYNDIIQPELPQIPVIEFPSRVRPAAWNAYR